MVRRLIRWIRRLWVFGRGSQGRASTEEPDPRCSALKDGDNSGNQLSARDVHHLATSEVGQQSESDSAGNFGNADVITRGVSDSAKDPGLEEQWPVGDPDAGMAVADDAGSLRQDASFSGGCRSIPLSSPPRENDPPTLPDLRFQAPHGDESAYIPLSEADTVHLDTPEPHQLPEPSPVPVEDLDSTEAKPNDLLYPSCTEPEGQRPVASSTAVITDAAPADCTKKHRPHESPEALDHPSPSPGSDPPPLPGRTVESPEGGTSPREIGGRRSPVPPSGKVPKQRRFVPQAELVCRRPRGSRSWQMILVIPAERGSADAYLDDNSLERIGDEFVLPSFVGTVTITYEDGDNHKEELFVDRPLVFKLPRNWEGIGRRVRGITKGHYIVIVPKEQPWSIADPVEAEPCRDRNFIARYVFKGDNSEIEAGSFDRSGLGLLDRSFNLVGDTVYDDHDHGVLFVGIPPELHCSSEIVWARIGQEERDGWGENFKPDERSIGEILDGREGRFFLRLYELHNGRTRLQDSRDFRYHSGLQEILVNNEPFSDGRVLAPSNAGHSETIIEFVRFDGGLLPPIADTVSEQASIGPEGRVVVAAHADADRVSCCLPSHRGQVETVINLPRIWWRLASHNQEPGQWVDVPIEMTRKGFRQQAEVGVAICVKLPRHVASVSVGFDGDEGQVHRPQKPGEEAEIPLSAFSGYTQIDHRLEEDALLKAQSGDIVLTLIRVTADPAPKIPDSGSKGSSIVNRGTPVLRQYELMTIHRPELNEGEYRQKVLELTEFLTNQGAIHQGIDPWGRRKLAYKINHVSEGYYTVNHFWSEPATVDALRRVLALTDDVLRHKIVRLGDTNR